MSPQYTELLLLSADSAESMLDHAEAYMRLMRTNNLVPASLLEPFSLESKERQTIHSFLVNAPVYIVQLLMIVRSQQTLVEQWVAQHDPEKDGSIQ